MRQVRTLLPVRDRNFLVIAASAIVLGLLAIACGSSPASGDARGVGPQPATPVGVAVARPQDPSDDAPAGSMPGPATTTSAAAPTLATPTAAAPEAAATALPAPPPPTSQRTVVEAPWTPFATVGGVVLRHPSSRVERVGFHQSNHDGARQLEVLPTAIHPITLPTRERVTASRTAADVVVDPHVAIRSPVTGTVLRAGTYVLYCEHRDDFAVIEPDDHPGWEVKVLHIDGVQVRRGARVEAGVTVLAAGPTPLPFSSQVDDHTAEPSWPHVHIEVVDPSIPDRPSPGGGC
ncbi:MAG TPA: hypothetical protein VHF25_03300 [Nitriliruptorales bacterium]|nr:hypothetical protein [Nitriliruptorales bacterium]